jgi:hypothetical protein
MTSRVIPDNHKINAEMKKYEEAEPDFVQSVPKKIKCS